MPGREEAARLVERGADDAAVGEPRPALVVRGEGDARLVASRSLGGGEREAQAPGVVAAAEARGIVMRGDAGRGRQRSPPRSWCARKKFSEPAVAIAAEAEISSASAVAATICARRYTLPEPAQPSSSSHDRA